MLQHNTQAERSRGKGLGRDESMAHLRAVTVARKLEGRQAVVEGRQAVVDAFRDGKRQDLTSKAGRSGIRPVQAGGAGIERASLFRLSRTY